MNRVRAAWLIAVVTCLGCRQRAAEPPAGPPARPDGPLALRAPPGAAPSSEIAIDNALPACLRVKTAATTTHRNLLLASLEMAGLQSAAACGCFSASLLARSTEGVAGAEVELATSAIAAPPSGETITVDVVATADLQALGGRPIILHLSCRPPS